MTLVITTLFSCQKEVNKITEEPAQTAKRSFVVTMEETKTAISGGVSAVKWSAGDKIDVYGYTDGDEVGKASFTLSSGAGEKTATFTIDDGQSLGDYDDYYAVYPSGKALKTASLPGVMELSSAIGTWDAQTAVEGSYDPSHALMTAMADGTTGKLVFRHGVAYFRIKIPEDNITKVKISLGGTPLQKRVSYDSEDGSIVGGGTNTTDIAISGTLVKNSYYYICAAPRKSADNRKMGTITVTYTHNSVDKALSTNSWSTEVVTAGYLYDLGCPPLPVVNPTISASNVSIESDDTAGSIAYTVNDGVPGGAISAEITSQTPASWLTLGADSGTAIAFTCAANATSDPKTATVRITYTYDTDKTVYKDVTVTQKGAGGGPTVHTYIYYVNDSKAEVQTADGASGSYFTLSGSSILDCSASGYFAVDSFEILGNNYSHAKKIDSSNGFSFTTSTGVSASIRFFAARRQSDKAGTVKLQVGSSNIVNADMTLGTIYDSGDVALAANTNYAFNKSGEIGLFYVVVTETEL